jgi:hypothetical protein
VCVCVCVCVLSISNCPLFPHSAWSYICVWHFKFPTFPRSYWKRKRDRENVCVRACVCVYSRISNRPHFPDLTGHGWFARIASCPHSSWTLSALASTLSCPFLPSKLGHKCACAALEVAGSSQFMFRHTCLCMHAEWNCPECPQCMQYNKNVENSPNRILAPPTVRWTTQLFATAIN